jgi:hypothetical protein
MLFVAKWPGTPPAPCRAFRRLAGLFGGGGGGGSGAAGVVCTPEARTSIALTVWDASGAPVPGAAVSYHVNGGLTLSQAAQVAGPGIAGAK